MPTATASRRPRRPRGAPARPPREARRGIHPTLAREPAGHYRATTDAAAPATPVAAPNDRPANDRPADGLPADSDAADARAGALRDAVADAARAMRRVVSLADDARVSGGQCEALGELLAVADQAQFAAVALTERIEAGAVAHRTVGLPLESWLAMSGSLPHAERRSLVRLAETLRAMPYLAGAWRAGHVTHAQVRAIVAETRVLNSDGRAQLDARFSDHDRLGRFDADQLLDAVRDAVARLRPDLAERRELRTIERRFLALQPAMDGGLTGYFELDAESGTLFSEALEAASPAPTAEHDHSRNADATIGHADNPDVDGDVAAADAQAAGERRRSRARQRADGLLCLAEAFLAGRRMDGTIRRARPRMYVWADLATLAGDDTAGQNARLLWQVIGRPVVLTPAGARRLASDADLQLIVHDNGRILGVSEPTATIPSGVRAAVQARDQGCRFPGCAMPVHQCDLHHVRAREHGGPTTIDNLVAVCRRHHTAVTQGRWKLTMTDDAVVTVRRGARTATGDPPHRRTFTVHAGGLDPPAHDPD